MSFPNALILNEISASLLCPWNHSSFREELGLLEANERIDPAWGQIQSPGRLYACLRLQANV